MTVSERELSRSALVTSAEERAVTSYPPRRRFKSDFYPPASPNVEETIDIHCHAHGGGQDALALAKFASESQMGGILYKSITGWMQPANAVDEIRDELAEWAEAEGVKPIQVWAGALISTDHKPPDVEWCVEQIDKGAIALWLPVFNHANTFYKVGGMATWFDRDADPEAHTDPLPWEEALKYGQYLLDDSGRLKPEVRDIVALCKDRDVTLSCGHATSKEREILVETMVDLGFKKGLIDHPFSPFIDLDIDDMKRMAAAGITMNFTYNELSPLLGIDPKLMYEAIREVGPAHFTLSSDAGDPLFPNSVECMRLICGHMEAYGLSKAELRQVSVENPARLVGVDAETLAAS